MPLKASTLETAFRRVLKKHAAPLTVQDARNAIRRKGWKHVEVARQLGVSPIHLSYVLTGRRESRRILSAISTLPNNPDPA